MAISWFTWPDETVSRTKKIVVGVELPNTTFIDLAPFSRRYSGGEGLGMRGRGSGGGRGSRPGGEARGQGARLGGRGRGSGAVHFGQAPSVVDTGVECPRFIPGLFSRFIVGLELGWPFPGSPGLTKRCQELRKSWSGLSCQTPLLSIWLPSPAGTPGEKGWG